LINEGYSNVDEPVPVSAQFRPVFTVMRAVLITTLGHCLWQKWRRKPVMDFAASALVSAVALLYEGPDILHLADANMVAHDTNADCSRTCKAYRTTSLHMRGKSDCMSS
jgi:hypothetical protein